MMMEKTSATYMSYQKKITPYLDGSLTAEEVSEFEAFVMTHPEFEANIKMREDEIYLLRSLIPNARLSPKLADSLENEIKSSIFNLLKPKPKSLWEGIKLNWEDWINR